MVDYLKKEANVVDNITSTVEKLDAELDKIDSLNKDATKEHEFKKWYAEKKALHEVKYILHEAGKYDQYDEDEMKKIDQYFDNFNS